jgi:predicted ATPase
MGGREDGVFFVDLSPITDPRLVPDTIATALLLRAESVGRPVLEILTDHLRNRSLLLTTTFHVGGLTSAASA